MPVTVEIPLEKWTGKVREVTIGATGGGGTRAKTVTVGGDSSLPFLHFEGTFPHPPAVAVEIQDILPSDWSPVLRSAWGEDTLKDVGAWAKKAEGLGADLLMLRLRGADADGKPTTAAQAAATVKTVLKSSGLPLMVRGPGQAEADNELLVAVAEAASGERLVLGLCEDKNYRTIVAAALAHGHLIINATPIDVNLAKQLNILVSDMRLDPDRILMDPTTGALGYGLEYTYSVMERLRLAALTGDSMTQMPIVCFVGEESWRQKESKVGEGVPALWGDWARRGKLWEIGTATALLEAGANIVTVRHPDNVAVVQSAIRSLMTK